MAKKEQKIPKIWQRYLEAVNANTIEEVYSPLHGNGEVWRSYKEGAEAIGTFLRSTRGISLESIPSSIIDALTKVGLESTVADDDIAWRTALSYVKDRFTKRGEEEYPLPGGENNEADNVGGSLQMMFNQGRNKHGRNIR